MFQYAKITQHISVLRNLREEERIYDIYIKSPKGSTYNTYIVEDEDNCVLVDPGKYMYTQELVEELGKYIELEKLSHVLITQSQPSHSGALAFLLERFPNIIVIGTPGAITFLKHITNTLFKSYEARANEVFNFGSLNIKFIPAPNLPWPDAMSVLVEQENVLLSGGVFSAHYCSQKVFLDELDENVNEIEKYKHALYQQYFWIFHPHNNFVHKAILKLKDLQDSISIIAPSFGPILRKEPQLLIQDYLTWSQEEEVDPKKVTLVYVSAHGYTEFMATRIANHLKDSGFTPKLIDLNEVDTDTAIHEINTSKAFLIGSPTIACDAVPPIWDVLVRLLVYKCEHKFCTVFGSFGWSGEAVKHIE